jgi:hypothetical protein
MRHEPYKTITIDKKATSVAFVDSLFAVRYRYTVVVLQI